MELYSHRPELNSLPLPDTAPLPTHPDAVALVQHMVARAQGLRASPAILTPVGHTAKVSPELVERLSHITVRPPSEWVDTWPAPAEDVWAASAHASLARGASAAERQYLQWYYGTIGALMRVHDMVPGELEGLVPYTGLAPSPYARTFHTLHEYVDTHGHLPSRNDPDVGIMVQSGSHLPKLMRGTSPEPGRGMAWAIANSTPWVAHRGLFTRSWVTRYHALAWAFANDDPLITTPALGDPAGRAWALLRVEYGSYRLSDAHIALLEGIPGWYWFKMPGSGAWLRWMEDGPSTLALTF